jgi:hypothetical protein
MLRAICAKALAHDPTSRYGSVTELADDLNAALHMQPTRALPLDFFGRFALWCQHPDRVFQGAVSILAVSGGSALFHFAGLLLAIARVYAGFEFFDPHHLMNLRYREIIATTIVFGAIGTAGAYAAYRVICGHSRSLWITLTIMGFHLVWVVSVLSGVVAFDVGGLLREPASLRTTYLFFLVLAVFTCIANVISLCAVRASTRSQHPQFHPQRSNNCYDLNSAQLR